MYNQVTVYVVWKHGSPHSRLGEVLWDRYNRISDDGVPSAAGIPVYFRSHLGPGGQLNPAIEAPKDGRRPLNLVLLLIDDAWIADARWRRVAESLAARNDIVLFYLALNPSASNLPGLTAMQGVMVADEGNPGVFDRAFLRAVTQAFARAVRERAGLGDGPLTVFLSHAKRDGREKAKALHGRIISYGQLDAFFDERDLPWGSSGWAGQLRDAVERGSAGMLVLETAAYASRPWCRAEVEIGRQPVRGAVGTPDEHVWRVVPTVVVGAPDDRWSKVLSELGNAARIGTTGDFATAALDRLVRDILLAATNRLRARAVVQAHPGCPCEALTWSPDPETIRHVRAAVGWEIDLVYPGNGLYRFEEARLVRPDGAPSARRTLYTYSDWLHGGPRPSDERLSGAPLVAVSVSESSDCARLGFGAQHENATLTAWTTELVQHGARVVFGGVLAETDDGGDNKTRPIVDVVVDYARGRHVTDPFPRHPPLVNYQPFPYYLKVTEKLRADLYGICQFAFVDPPGWTDSIPPPEERSRIAAAGSTDRSRAAVQALSRMRETMPRGASVGPRDQLVTDDVDA